MNLKQYLFYYLLVYIGNSTEYEIITKGSSSLFHSFYYPSMIQ